MNLMKKNIESITDGSLYDYFPHVQESTGVDMYEKYFLLPSPSSINSKCCQSSSFGTLDRLYE